VSTTREPASDSATPPARVPGNRWTAIEVEEIAAVDARLTVSIVVCGADPAGLTPLTLAGLAEQTYPATLIEVVVGAGSGVPEAELRAAGNGLELSFATPSDAGSALAGVEGARGDVLLLIPAGAIPAPELVEAHARWHHAVGDAVSVGISRAVDVESLRAADVADGHESGRLEDRLERRRVPGRADEETVETYLERTRDLTERRDDLFRLAGRGSAAMRAATYHEAGGAGSEEDGALARLDLAYRLECLGCVFVAERRAVTFEHYPYDGPALQGAADDLLENGGGPHATVAPSVADRFPTPGFRARESSRMHTRPAIAVNVPVGEESAEDVLETVDAVLRGHFQDLQLRLTGTDDHAERRLIEASCASDPRIVLGRPTTDTASEIPYHVDLPGVAVPDERTFEDIHDLMTKEGVGALHVTVPGELPRNAMVEVVATGPLARSRRVAAATGEPVETVLGQLFGERWVSGVEVSIRRRGAPEPQVTEHGPLARATDIEHERKQHLRHSARAATNRARADRYLQRAERERLRARAERERAGRVEARIARAESSRAYVLLRPLRRLGGALRARVRR
jgi:hypothetical protein